MNLFDYSDPDAPLTPEAAESELGTLETMPQASIDAAYAAIAKIDAEKAKKS